MNWMKINMHFFIAVGFNQRVKLVNKPGFSQNKHKKAIQSSY